MAVLFENRYCHFQMFPDPIMIEKENINDVIRFINFINSHFKLHNCNGRFYVDEDDLDVVFVQENLINSLKHFLRSVLQRVYQ